jgi:hypothetical protein
VQAMQYPAAGEPHRPTELQVRPDERWEALRPHLDEIGVNLAGAEELDMMEVVFQEMCEHVCGKPQPGLLDMPGMKPDQVGSFYEAAACFFQQSPWKKVGYEAAIKVECDKFQSGPWYAVLMGQSGLTMGLALYEDLKALRRMWAGGGDEENARRTVGTSVTFGEEWDIPVADLEAAKGHGWQVARPDAYPSAYRKESGLSMRLPLVWEMELLEGCLRAVPAFVKRHILDDAATEEMTVPAGSAELLMVLSWVAESGKGGNMERDYLLDTANEQWNNLLHAYKQYEDKKPIVLFDIQERRIYVYPYEEFKNDMSAKSQASLTEQYEIALQENKFVVFIRDNEQRRLVSFSMDYK